MNRTTYSHLIVNGACQNCSATNFTQSCPGPLVPAVPKPFALDQQPSCPTSLGEVWTGTVKTSTNALLAATGVPVDEEKLVEKVAEAIYHGKARLTDDEYEKKHGQKRAYWKALDPWDTGFDEWRPVLDEHKREKYRRMARAAIKAVKE